MSGPIVQSQSPLSPPPHSPLSTSISISLLFFLSHTLCVVWSCALSITSQFKICLSRLFAFFALFPLNIFFLERIGRVELEIKLEL